MSKGRKFEDYATLGVISMFLIPALVGLASFYMDTCQGEPIGPTMDAAAGKAAAVATMSRSDRPPSGCIEGNACYPDSKGPLDCICMSAVDRSVMLRCIGGRLVRSDGK